MEIINITNKDISILLSKEELGILRSVSMHILYEFAMDSTYNIFISTGWEKNDAQSFSNKLQEQYEIIKENKIEYIFSYKELNFIIKIIEDAVREINWEFQTLTGYSTEEALELKKSFQKILLT